MASRRVSLLVEFQDREVMPSVEAMASFEVSQDPSKATTNGMVVVSGEYFRIFSSCADCRFSGSSNGMVTSMKTGGSTEVMRRSGRRRVPS